MTFFQVVLPLRELVFHKDRSNRNALLEMGAGNAMVALCRRTEDRLQNLTLLSTQFAVMAAILVGQEEVRIESLCECVCVCV